MDDRRGRGGRLDEATFAPAPLRARGRPPILGAGVAIVIVALVGAAMLDRLGDERSVPGASLPGLSTSAAIAGDSPLPTRPSRPSRPSGPAIPTIRPQLMKLDLRPDGRHLFVYGDVFSLEAFIVVVSLEDRGVVTDTVTLSMPGGSTAFLTDANPRFQARFDMPAGAPIGSVWVRANAYDTHGDLMLSLRQAVV